MKPALIATTKIKSSKYEDKDVPALLSAFSDMYPGQLVVGYVLKAEAYGVVCDLGTSSQGYAQRGLYHLIPRESPSATSMAIP